MSEEVWGWSHYFSELARFFHSTENNFGSANRQYTEYCISRLALCYRNVDAVKESVQTHNNDAESNGDLQTIEQDLTELLECISQMFSQWQQYLHTIDEEDDSIRYRAPIQAPSGSRGRPPFIITKEQLVYMRSLSFSWSEISKLLGVSRMTIYRRRREYNLIDEPSRSMLDTNLYQFIRDLRVELPDVGEAMVIGRLCSLGYSISRERIHLAIRSTDPL